MLRALSARALGLRLRPLPPTTSRLLPGGFLLPQNNPGGGFLLKAGFSSVPRMTREDFKKLKGQKLVDVLKENGLNLDDDDFKKLIDAKLSGEELMGTKAEVRAFLKEEVTLPAGSTKNLLEWAFNTFSVKVPVIIDGERRTVSLSPNSTVDDLLELLTSEQKYGLKGKSPTDLGVLVDGSAPNFSTPLTEGQEITVIKEVKVTVKVPGKFERVVSLPPKLLVSDLLSKVAGDPLLVSPNAPPEQLKAFHDQSELKLTTPLESYDGKTIVLEVSTPSVQLQDPIELLDSLFKNELEQKAAPKKAGRELGFGEQFPYQGRDQLQEAFMKEFATYLAKEKKNRDTAELLTLTAAPGTGKTRAIWEIADRLKELINTNDPLFPSLKGFTVIHLHTTYNSGKSIEKEFDKELGANSSLAVRFYFNYFLEGKDGQGFSGFRDTLMSHLSSLKRLRLTKVLDKIQKHHGRPCFFFISVDDVQKAFPDDGRVTNDSFAGGLLSTLGTLLLDDVRNLGLFAYPLVVGTLFGPIASFTSSSSQRTTPLLLPMLNKENQDAIVHSVLKDYKEKEKYDWTEDAQLRRLIKVFGDFPRGLETILQVYISQHAFGLPFEEINTSSVIGGFSEMERKLGHLDLQVTKELIRLWILGKRVQDKDVILESKHSFDTLESAGYLSLTDPKVNTGPKGLPVKNFKLHIRGFALLALASAHRETFPIFEGVLQYALSLNPGPTNFEYLIAHMVALRTDLLRPKTLGELFAGAKFSPEDVSKRAYHGGSSVEEHPTETFTQLKGLCLENPGVIFTTGDSNPGFDFFFQTDAPTKKKEDQDLILINCKRIKEDATDKTRKAFTTTAALQKMGAFDRFPAIIVGVISTGKISLETALKPAEKKDALAAGGAQPKQEEPLDFPERVFAIGQGEAIKTFLGPFSDFYDLP